MRTICRRAAVGKTISSPAAFHSEFFTRARYTVHERTAPVQWSLNHVLRKAFGEGLPTSQNTAVQATVAHQRDQQIAERVCTEYFASFLPVGYVDVSSVAANFRGGK